MHRQKQQCVEPLSTTEEYVRIKAERGALEIQMDRCNGWDEWMEGWKDKWMMDGRMDRWKD